MKTKNLRNFRNLGWLCAFISAVAQGVEYYRDKVDSAHSFSVYTIVFLNLVILTGFLGAKGNEVSDYRR